MQRYSKFAAFILAYASTLSTALGAEPATGSVVYDSISNPAGGGFAIQSLDIGQSIILQGGARHITQIDLLLFDSASDEFRVRFYSLDPITGVPSDVIWESETQRSPYGNTEIIGITVPGVLVPEKMAWTIAPLSPTTTINLMVRTGSLTPGAATGPAPRRPQFDGEGDSTEPNVERVIQVAERAIGNPN